MKLPNAITPVFRGQGAPVFKDGSTGNFQEGERMTIKEIRFRAKSESQEVEVVATLDPADDVDNCFQLLRSRAVLEILRGERAYGMGAEAREQPEEELSK